MILAAMKSEAVLVFERWLEALNGRTKLEEFNPVRS
jgi:hypothetical protein